MDRVRIAHTTRFHSLMLGVAVAVLLLSACAAPPTPVPPAPTSAPVATAVPASSSSSAASSASSISPTAAPTKAPASPTPAGAAQKGGSIVVGLAATAIQTLDPAAFSDRPTETVIRNMFDGLVTRTTTNQVVLELAQSFQWVDDKTVEFKLKKNVTFHNGDPFTAEDVVFTFDRVMKQDIGAPRRFATSGIKSVEKVDDYTVRFV